MKKLAILFACAALAACGRGGEADSTAATAVADDRPGPLLLAFPKGHSKAEEKIVLKNATVRAPMGGRTITAAFIDIDNLGRKSDELVSVSSSVAEVIEIHDVIDQDGVMRMRKVDGFEVEGGETLSLASGGKHLMLINLTETLEPGAEIPLTLGFKNAGDIEVTAKVVTADGAGHSN